MKVSEFTFDSSTAHNKIFTRLYEPDGEPKAVLQISHGMAEHSALYKPFCEYMAQRGFVVVINDHLGPWPQCDLRRALRAFRRKGRPL
ncbi:alpha/beta hydrolase [Hominenteromicrobium sp.]|uniref:alpha/beta hydrolase n=1 Tax=Hominenteromicrobium sp. TaxID=3073581 RepID=UPI003AB6A71D